MIVTSTAKNRVSACLFRNKETQRAADTTALPELVLVCFDDLALQLEGLFGKQLEVSDVV